MTRGAPARGIESQSFRTVLGRLRTSYERYALPASFAIGAAFGLVKMPCVGGLYIAILGTILQSERFAEGLAISCLFITWASSCRCWRWAACWPTGSVPASLNAFRLRHRVKLKLFTGLLLAAMAAGFALGVI